MELLLIAAVLLSFILGAYMVMGLNSSSDSYQLSMPAGSDANNTALKQYTKKIFATAGKVKK